MHNVSDDAKLIKVAPSTLSSERLLEGDHHRGNVVSVPGGTEQPVPEPDGHQVLDHLLAQVVIDSVQLLLPKQR